MAENIEHRPKEHHVAVFPHPFPTPSPAALKSDIYTNGGNDDQSKGQIHVPL
jgi:hypothetical protein